jgi:hypothetical protein
MCSRIATFKVVNKSDKNLARIDIPEDNGIMIDQAALKQFQDAGGKITTCPPCNTIYRPPETNRKAKRPECSDNAICSPCKNNGQCKALCPPLQWIDGNVQRRERFITKEMLNTPQADYNEVCHELSDNKQFPITLTDIQAISDIRHRAICSMLMVQIPKREIARLLQLSRTQLYRIIHTMLHRNYPLSLKKSDVSLIP